MDFIESIKYLSDLAGIKFVQEYKKDPKEIELYDRIIEINIEAQKWFASYLYKNPEVMKYCEVRSISKDSIDFFGIGYAPKNDSIWKYLKNLGFAEDDIIEASIAWRDDNGILKDSFYDRLMIPIKDIKGNIVAFGGRIISKDENRAKYKNSAENLLFKKSDIVFNLNNVKGLNKGPILVVEGYMDVISLHSSGFENTVAVMGTSFTQSQLNYIWKYTDILTFCFDGDNAGYKATEKSLEIILQNINNKKQAKFIILPDKLDPDQIVSLGKAKFLQSKIDNAYNLYDAIWLFCSNNKKSEFYTDIEVDNIQLSIDQKLNLIKDKHLKSNVSYYFKRKLWEVRKKAKKLDKVDGVSCDSNISDNDKLISDILLHLVKNQELIYLYYDDIMRIYTENISLDEIIINIINGSCCDDDINILINNPFNVVYKNFNSEKLNIYIGLAIKKVLLRQMQIERSAAIYDANKFGLLTKEIELTLAKVKELELSFGTED